jgi:hypothetical protein
MRSMSCYHTIPSLRAEGVVLAEDHVLLGAVERLPHPDAPLERSAHIRIGIGTPTDDLV